ncbi:alpha/beta hydrolase [Providencia rettgeri]|uniref:alpha/beta hydrolase n=1 Tax=Providencia TaxID=586 RepID=UPI001933BCA3|nr:MULTISPECIES: alpha/beta hydrolase [unclassified Providencia]
MRKILFALLVNFMMTFFAFSSSETRQFPIPNTVSTQMQSLIAKPASSWDVHPKNTQEWNQWVQDFDTAIETTLPALRQQLEVSLEANKLGNVPIFILTPKRMKKENQDRVLLNLHGGGYVLGAGEAGTLEATYMAGIAGYRVIVVDYRMPPEHPYPAALDDAFDAYQTLLKSVPANKIGVFGTSAGGGMTLALMLRIKTAGLPLPAAIAPGTPWSDLTKTGDSYFTNEGVDNVLVSYDGWLGDAAKLYANGHDLKGPMLSPVYSDVTGFPPTLLTSGTRDLFLSNTVRMHLKLRQAGVDANLMILEGISHAQYHMDPNASETITHFTEVGHFFSQYLR